MGLYQYGIIKAMGTRLELIDLYTVIHTTYDRSHDLASGWVLTSLISPVGPTAPDGRQAMQWWFYLARFYK